MNVEWPVLKAFVDERDLSIQWIDNNYGVYMLSATDSGVTLRCNLVQSNENEDLEDFETNYKDLGNKKRGLFFQAVGFEVTTSTLLGSLFCEDSQGVAIDWVTARIYNGSDEEITTAGIGNANLLTCVKTVVDIEPPYDFEFAKGVLRTSAVLNTDVRLWGVIAPDIPSASGGSREFITSVNLKYLTAGNNTWESAPNYPRSIVYNAVTHTGKLRLIFKHTAGLQASFLFVIHMYKA